MQQKTHYKHTSNVMAFLISLIVTIPVFIIIHKHLPAFSWALGIDRIAIFIAIFLLFFLILKTVPILVYLLFFSVVIWISVGYFTQGYGVGDVYKDYRAMLFAMEKDPNPERILLSDTKMVPYKQKILNAIDYENPKLRDFAVSSVNTYFVDLQKSNFDERQWIQAFAIFKNINSQWNYVNDPRSREYYAKASESAKLLAGDCDDHSILMVAALLAIGATPRLIITTGHIYPEIYIGDKGNLERVNYLIKKQLFPQLGTVEGIHYHEDEDGKIWLNLDYTADYPGGKFMAEPVLNVLYP